MKKITAAFVAIVLSALCACGSDAGKETAESHSIYTRSTISAAEESEPPQVEVVPTDTSQQQSTIFNESLTSMLKPMDAVMVASKTTGVSYDPENAVSVWTIMYYYLSLYGPLAQGVEYTENDEYLSVGDDVVREVARIIYGEAYTLPEIPEQIQRISLRDDGHYYVKMDPRPDEGYPVFCSAVKNGDGTYEAVSQLLTFHGKITYTQSFHFEPKSDTNALLGESYAYTIGSMGVG